MYLGSRLNRPRCPLMLSTTRSSLLEIISCFALQSRTGKSISSSIGITKIFACMRPSAAARSPSVAPLLHGRIRNTNRRNGFRPRRHHIDWQLVQPEMAKFARVCTYDRAGMGWSEAGSQPRTSRQIVRELHTLLGNAGVRGPYVLVGHSFGGTNMQVYASQYPDEVAGMALVDSALEDEKAVALTQSHQPSPLLMKIYATIGLTRLPYTLGGETSGLTSPELEDEQAAISSHRKHIFAVPDETSSLEESFDENRADPISLVDKPLMVLTAGSVQLAGTGLSRDQVNLIDELHSESQAALTRRSENAKQIIVEDSGHYIHVEQPGLVTDAIHQVVEAARDGSRLSGNEASPR